MPPKRFEIPSPLPAAVPSSASRSGIVSAHSRHPWPVRRSIIRHLRHDLKPELAHLRCAMRTGGVHRERPAPRRTFVRGPTSQFSISLVAQFVVKFLLGSPAEVRKRG